MVRNGRVDIYGTPKNDCPPRTHVGGIHRQVNIMYILGLSILPTSGMPISAGLETPYSFSCACSCVRSSSLSVDNVEIFIDPPFSPLSCSLSACSPIRLKYSLRA